MTEEKKTARVNMLWPPTLKERVQEKVGQRGVTQFVLEAVEAKLANAAPDDAAKEARQKAEKERDEARGVAQSLADSIVAGWPIGDEFDQLGALKDANLPSWIDTNGWSSEYAALVQGSSVASLDPGPDSVNEDAPAPVEEVESSPEPEPKEPEEEDDGGEDEDLHKPMFLTGKKKGEDVPAETPPVTPVELPHDRQPDDFLAKVLAKGKEKGVDLSEAHLKPASEMKKPESKVEEPEPESEPEPEPEPTPAPASDRCQTCGSELVGDECWECF